MLHQKAVKTNETAKKNLLEHLEPISDGIKAQNGIKLPKSQSFEEKNSSEQHAEGASLVHSWSYCISDSDNVNAELELSMSAEEFFSDTDHAVVIEVLNEILNNVCNEVDKRSSRPLDLDLKPKISDHVAKISISTPCTIICVCTVTFSTPIWSYMR